MNIIKSKAFFEKALDKIFELRNFYFERFKRIEGIDLCKSKIALAINYLNGIHVKYSIGESKTELRNEIPEVIALLKEFWHSDLVRFKKGRKPVYLDMYLLEYNFFLRKLLSFMVLLDVDKSYFEVIKNLIDRDKIKDGLYDFLLSCQFIGRNISPDIYPAKPENKIMYIIFENEKEKCESLIKTYLEKEWYGTYKNAGFYNSHKLPEERYSFYGYWAFEVAAIVKIKGLDDSSFKDNPYYPKDLV